VDVQVYRSLDDPHIYVRKISPQIEEFVKKERLPVKVIHDWTKVLGDGSLKLLFIGQAEVLLDLREALKGVTATAVRSERNYLEVLPPGISKGAGLAWLCAWLGIPLERVAAVGDKVMCPCLSGWVSEGPWLMLLNLFAARPILPSLQFPNSVSS